MFTEGSNLTLLSFQLLAENADTGLWIRSTAERRILYANQFLEVFLGVQRSVLHASDEAWLAAICDEDRSRIAASWARADWDDYLEQYRILGPTGDTIWLEDRASVVSCEQETLIVGSTRRIACESQDCGILRRQVISRNAQIAALLAGSRDLTATLELDELLRRILDRLQTLVAYTGTGVILREGEEWIIKAVRGPFDGHTVLARPVNLESAIVRQIMTTRLPLVINDTTADDEIRQDLLSIPPVDDVESDFRYIRSWMGVPLVSNDEVIGLLFVDHRNRDWFTPQRQELVAAFSDQVAVAVKNARMYRDLQNRVAELNGVQRATTALLETHDLETILQIACQEACALAGAQAGAVFAFGDGVLSLEKQYGSIDMDRTAIHQVARNCCRTAATISRGEASERTLSVSDSGLRLSAVAIPLYMQESCAGALCVASHERTFGEEEARVLALLANNVAMAVNSAELAYRGQQLAVMQERQRLAMELHDSTTQAIYGASLLADAVRLAMTAERYEAADTKLRKLQDTIDEAMRGMRVMVYELRPPNLEEGLAVALERRLSAVESRVGLKTELSVHDEQRLDEEVEAQVYWIATEGLNNIVRHARAGSITVELRYRGSGLVLTIVDDGIGFSAESLPRKMGLGISGMHERARSIGGQLLLESTPGLGSRIVLTVPY